MFDNHDAGVSTGEEVDRILAKASIKIPPSRKTALLELLKGSTTGAEFEEKAADLVPKSVLVKVVDQLKQLVGKNNCFDLKKYLDDKELSLMCEKDELQEMIAAAFKSLSEKSLIEALEFVDESQREVLTKDLLKHLRQQIAQADESSSKTPSTPSREFKSKRSIEAKDISAEDNLPTARKEKPPSDHSSTKAEDSAPSSVVGPEEKEKPSSKVCDNSTEPAKTEKNHAPMKPYSLMEDYLDVGDADQISKAIVDYKKLLEMKSSLTDKVFAVGFFGENEEAIKNAERFLQLSIDMESAEISECQKFKIYACAKDEKLALILLSPKQSFIHKTDKRSTLIDFLRFLIDVCSSIHVSVPHGLKILQGESMLKQVRETQVTLQTLVRKENADLALEAVKVVGVSPISLRLFSGRDPKLIFAEFVHKEEIIERRVGTYRRNLQESLQEMKRLSGFNSKESLIERIHCFFDHFVPLESNKEFRDSVAELIENGSKYKYFCWNKFVIHGVQDYYLAYSDLKKLVKKYCKTHEKQVRIEMRMELYRLSFVKTSDGAISMGNVTKDKIMFSKQLKNVETYCIRDFYSMGEDSGFFILSNYPEHKSTLISYEGSRGTTTSSEMMTLSTDETRFVLNQVTLLFLMYDNKEKRCQIGRMTKSNKMGDVKLVSIYNRSGCPVEEVVSACIVTVNDWVLLLDVSGKIYCYVYVSDDLKEIIRLSATHEKIPICPKNSEETYRTVACAVNQRLIYLQCRSSIDIYDINFEPIKSIEITPKFLNFSAISSGQNEFILIKNLTELECVRLCNFESSIDFNFESKNKTEESKGVSNPIVDYLWLATSKFGQSSTMVGSATRVGLLVDCPPDQLDNFEDYYNSLGVPLLNFQAGKKDYNRKLLDRETFYRIFISRIPLHIASVQNYTLIPLNNGKYDYDKFYSILYQKRRAGSIVNELSDNIQFGQYESLINSWSGRIGVVSIIGRQSSGKSYMLNRMFGTRFNVAATRCTDGIWMSTSVIEHQGKQVLLVVLDCEGLFSIARSAAEETKLCLTLSAISDIFIVNQDLSYSRNINTLLNNLSAAVGKLKGRQLFQGCLVFFVRDVSESSFQDAQREFRANITTIVNDQDSFIIKMFRGRVHNFLLPHFEQNSFDTYVRDIRASCLSELNNDRWKCGEDFLFSLKIILSQLMIDDDISLDDHKSKIKVQRNFNSVIAAFYNCKELETDSEDVFVTCDENPQEVKFKHSSIDLEEVITCEMENEGIITSNQLKENQQNLLKSVPFKDLDAFLCEHFESYSKKNHNAWVQNRVKFLESFFQTRGRHVRTLFKKLMSSEPKEVQDRLEKYLEGFFGEINKLVSFCSKTCRQCARRCVLKINHTSDCDCDTDHLCCEPCTILEICKEDKNTCGRNFGHEGQHTCSVQKHKCPNSCSVAGCKFFCQLEIGHPELLHNCKNKHVCDHKCRQKNCHKSCFIERDTDHPEHSCGDKICSTKCKFCDALCCEENHFHEELISVTGDEKPSCMDHHNCGKEHSCQNTCKNEGICNIGYQAIDKELKTELSIIKYTYFKPFNSKENCVSTLPQKCQTHHGSCKCNVETHRCNQQCPECNSFCSEQFGHMGLHHTANHRNKEQYSFVSESEKGVITINTAESKKMYRPGETCEPEICSESCKRKFRAHFHLKQCPGADSCPSKLNPKVRHSTKTYYPFVDRKYDEWLCEDFWKSYNWKEPVSDEIAKINRLCNSYCVRCYTDKSKPPTEFCTKPALHDGKHELPCPHAKGGSTFQIAFCCDTTGSMSAYINKSKETVKNIVSAVKKVSAGLEAEFAFVAYRDHPPQDTSYVTQIKNFCNESEIVSHIATVCAAGGGDTPEAVLDGINDCATKLSWKSGSNKYLFHIADAPPHGREYSTSDDGFPSGCPCGLKIERIAETLASKEIIFRLIKIGSLPNTMDVIFASKIKNYNSQQIDSPLNMDFHITNAIIEDLKNMEIDARI